MKMLALQPLTNGGWSTTTRRSIIVMHWSPLGCTVAFSGRHGATWIQKCLVGHDPLARYFIRLLDFLPLVL